MMKRRRFMCAGAAGALAAGAFPAAVLGAALPLRAPFSFRAIGGKAMLMDLTDEIFGALAGTRFSAARAGAAGASAGARAELVLDRVVRHEADEGRIRFSLRFEGPPEPALAQGLHLFSHPALGAFDLFIVPVGRSARGMQYEAAFSRPAAKP